ncbi:TrkA C-terminal domain-containing protein, partial [Paraflavisolibacter sp. H34]|uniref:TrkA C-terminal domain-containing protein n=1 Tax=Huijunlia imazamoxiresistens TaxID=3127457 RepID=UPI003016E875
ANAVGFSPALGAFIMGSILAETTKAEKIEHLIKPVKDLFGAIFFVSVGMLINPQVLLEYAVPILILCGVTIVGKVLSTAIGALVSGQPLQTSIQAGFSLAQIGEFSFIIATLGLTLKVTSSFLYPIAVAVSAVTTLTTPYLIQASGGLYHWLHHRLPAPLLARLNSYSSETKAVSFQSEWKRFIRSTVINSVLLSIVIVSLIFMASELALPWINQEGGSMTLKIGTAFLTLLLLLPFLWALAVKSGSEAHSNVIFTSRYRGLVFVVRLARLGLAAFFIGFLLHRFFHLYVGLGVTALMITLLVVFSDRIRDYYKKIESRFFTNLNQREIAAARSNRQELAPWNAHIVPVEVGPFAPCAGKTLLELRWRETTGINVVLIKRGEHSIAVPGKEQMVFPGDQLLVLGTDHQVQRLKVSLRSREDGAAEKAPTQVELHRSVIAAESSLAGRTIRQTGLREKAQALVVGIERNGERTLNPESDMVLLAGDTVFVVGDKKQLTRVL